MSRALLTLALLFVTACSSGDGVAPATSATAAPTTSPTSPPAPPPTDDPPGATTAPPHSTTTSTTSPTTTSPRPPSTTPPATKAPPTEVGSPGSYEDRELVIRLAFVSEVPEVASSDLASFALEVLNEPSGWGRSGFTFVADDSSELRVVLAEGGRVDELCLPLETFGTVSCQNGSVVALNADRWRRGAGDWDSTVAAYRVYLINHEVGHLIGLRHPRGRCPTADRISAVMEPQTNNLGGCRGNGIPLDWEIEWASNRPAVVGPAADWDGPRPEWPRA